MTDFYSLKFVANISDLDRAERELEKIQRQLDKLKQPTTVPLNVPDLEAKARQLQSYIQNLKNADKVLDDFRTSAASVGKALALVTAGAAAAGGALFVAFNRINERIGVLDDIADKTGLTIEQLSIMQQVAQNSGLGIESLSDKLTFLQRAQNEATNSSSKQAAAFKLLGISQKQALGDTGELVDLIANRMSKLDDGWQKNSVSMALFGKSGSEINEFLADYANRGGIVADITTQMRNEADLYNRSMASLKAIGDSFVAVFGAGVMPVMSALAKQFVVLANGALNLDKNSRELLKNDITTWAWKAAESVAWLGDAGYKTAMLFKGLAITIGGVGFSIAALFDLITSKPEEIIQKLKAFKQTLSEIGAAGDDAFGKAFGAKNPLGDIVAAAKAAGGVTPGASTPSSSPVRSTGQVTQAAKAQTEMNALLEKANSLLEKEQSAYLSVIGVQKEVYSLEGRLTELKEKAEATGNKELIHKIEVLSADARLLASETERQKTAKLTAENIIKMREAQDQLTTSTERWAQIVKTTEYGSLINKVKSPQEQAADQYNSARLDIKNGGESKATDFRNKADEARKVGNTTLANGYDATADGVLAEMNTQLERLKANYEQTQAVSGSAWEGMKQGMENFGKGLPTIANEFENLTRTGLNGLADGITTLVTSGGNSFKKFTSDLLKQIAQMIIKMLALRAIMAAIGLAGAAPVASAAPTIAGDAPITNYVAKGDVFSPAGVLFSAKGNVFNGTTLHTYGNGQIGAIGEKGTEAVMPLGRTSTGDLGVKMIGSAGGSGGNTFQISVSVTMPNGNAGDATDQKNLAKVISDTTEAMVYRIINKEKRDGGILAA